MSIFKKAFVAGIIAIAMIGTSNPKHTVTQSFNNIENTISLATNSNILLSQGIGNGD
ncbi:hypothetical protein [endosymbiont of Acanthamoeba sp. UWC8]|uniref:hypothetical protein n=1 Tax=endosymbiont of Acanthamoeba sp. UWC8 TaxID=86106 RepID=UPI00130ED207|nr:hypothetical protein [endosymbiont of Acanthamoeba sp. UWC8]